MKGPGEVKKGRSTPSGSRLIVAVGAAGCAGFLLTFARPAEPTPPVLAFEPAAVAAVALADRERLADADPEPTGPAAEGWHLYHRAGEVEVGSESRAEREARQRTIADAVDALVEARGEGALAVLRSRALAELERALAGELEGAEEVAAIGAFPATTEAYGVFADGEPIAPPFVVRTLFAARFNGILGLELTAGMTDVEKKAYFGWLALEAPEPPPALRARAMEALTELDPDLANGAEAHRAFLSGHPAEAAARYERLPTLRARNAALGAQSGF